MFLRYSFKIIFPAIVMASWMGKTRARRDMPDRRSSVKNGTYIPRWNQKHASGSKRKSEAWLMQTHILGFCTVNCLHKNQDDFHREGAKVSKKTLLNLRVLRPFAVNLFRLVRLRGWTFTSAGKNYRSETTRQKEQHCNLG